MSSTRGELPLLRERLVCLSACLGSCHHNLDCDGAQRGWWIFTPLQFVAFGAWRAGRCRGTSLQSALCTRGLRKYGTLRPHAILTVFWNSRRVTQHT